jgi:hypothetical protein
VLCFISMTDPSLTRFRDLWAVPPWPQHDKDDLHGRGIRWSASVPPIGQLSNLEFVAHLDHLLKDPKDRPVAVRVLPQCHVEEHDRVVGARTGGNLATSEPVTDCDRSRDRASLRTPARLLGRSDIRALASRSAPIDDVGLGWPHGHGSAETQVGAATRTTTNDHTK